MDAGSPVTPPSGTVTFLFTDIEGSTRLWERDPEAMAVAIADHDEVLRAAIARHDGYVFATGGDGFAAAFSAPSAAIAAAVEAQQKLAARTWPPTCELRVRMGVHLGEAVERSGDYFGPPVNLSARLMGIAHGGQIVCSRAIGDTLDRNADLTDLGEHRMRDVEGSVHVMQVCAAGLVADFPPLRSLDHVRSNLAHELSSFVGREDDVAALADALRDSRLVSVIGVGGVGKTRLAQRVGADLVDQFDDGVWFCELAPVRDHDAVVDAVAASLKYAPPSGLDLRTGLLQYLEHKQLLLILDNCEHLVGASAHFAAEFLAACRGLRILVTSREALAIAGERAHGVRSLTVPTDDDPATVRESEAGRLFVARARDARDDWALDGANTAAVAEICRRLDGIPLALELAAARTAMFEPTDIAARIDERFALLAGANRTAVDRHQTLRATVDWSYELLDERERRLLQQISTFVGGFDLHALTTIAIAAGFGELEGIDVLGSLVAKSLVERDKSRVGRYRTLETIRQYAAERLDLASESAEAHDRHADYYYAFASSALAALRTQDDYDAIDRLVSETANTAAAMNWSAARGDVARWFMLFEIVPPVMLSTLPSSTTEALARTLESMLTRPNASQTRGFAAACCFVLAVANETADDERMQRFELLVTLAPDDPYSALGVAFPHGRRGDMQRGTMATREALARLAPNCDPLLRSEVLALLTIYESIVDSDRARTHGEEGVALARAHGGSLARLYPLLALALNCARRTPPDVDAAWAAAKECASLDRTSRRPHSSLASSMAAYAVAVRGELELAVPVFRESIVGLDRAGHRMALAITAGTIADTIAPRDRNAAVDLLCVAESGAIADVNVRDNVYFTNLQALVAELDLGDLARRRAEYSTMSYEDAVALVLERLDQLV